MSPVALDDLYRVTVGVWGIPPGDFWSLTMREFWWIYDARNPPEKVGGMTAPEIDRAIARQRELDRRLDGVEGPERQRIIRDFMKEGYEPG